MHPVLCAILVILAMSTLAWLTAKLAGTPTPDPEVARARERNRLRDLGTQMRADRATHVEKRAEHERVYKRMLAASKGNTTSEFYKRALNAKRQMAECDRDIRSIDARLVPLEQTLRAAVNRQRDSEYNQLMSNLVTAEETAPNAPSRADMGAVMSRANKLVSDTDGLERDLDALDMNPVDDMSAMDAEMAADYQAMLAEEMNGVSNAPVPEVVSLSSSSSMRHTASPAPGGSGAYVPSEAERAAALEASIRNPQSWTPPSGFNYANQ